VAEQLHTWEVYYPAGGATGLYIARCRIDPTDVLWLHAVPEVISVTLRLGDDRVLARGEGLVRDGSQLPMTRLTRHEERIVREDRWPVDTDLGALVLLPGGEAGTLMSWWNAPDGSEWRWQLEFYNRR
jgi:hypothetical protein